MAGALDELEHRLLIQALIRSLSNQGEQQDGRARLEELLRERAAQTGSIPESS